MASSQGVALDEGHRGRAPGQGLDAQRPGAGEEVDHLQAVHPAQAEEDVVDGLADPVRGGADVVGHGRGRAPAPVSPPITRIAPPYRRPLRAPRRGGGRTWVRSERFEGGRDREMQVRRAVGGRCAEIPGAAVGVHRRVATEEVVAHPAAAGLIPTIGADRTVPPSEPRNGAPKANTPPSDPTSQYPVPSGEAAMPTIGAARVRPPNEPRNTASPKANTPPSDPTSQYPLPSGEAAMPTIGAARVRRASEPRNTASPKANTPPSDPTSQYPLPSGEAAMPTIRPTSGGAQERCSTWRHRRRTPRRPTRRPAATAVGRADDAVDGTVEGWV